MMTSILDLNNDALRAVLIRTAASDHANLRSTCQRFRDILDSPEFRRERSEEGFVEITVGLDEADSEEEDEPHNHIVDRARMLIYLDGQEGGAADTVLLPLRTTRHLQNFAAMYSDDLELLTTSLFTRLGRPRLASVKEAYDRSHRQDPPFLLFIESFALDDPMYRTTSLTGARALRSILLDDRAAWIQRLWTIAVYIPDASVYFDAADRTTQCKFDDHQYASAGNTYVEGRSTEEQQADKQWGKRVNTLLKRDMKQFFRAGFRQVPETALENDDFHLIAAPSDLQGQPLLSEEETMQVSIVERPPMPEEPSGVSLKLFLTMKNFCCRRKDITLRIDRMESSLENPREHPDFHRYEEVVEQAFEEAVEQTFPEAFAIKRRVEELTARAERLLSLIIRTRDIIRLVDSDEAERRLRADAPDFFEEGLSTEQCVQRQIALAEESLSMLRDLLGELPTLPNPMQLFCQWQRQNIEETRVQLAGFDERVRKEVSAMIDQEGHGILKTSNALHACAFHQEPDFIKLILSLVPEVEAKDAINSFDNNGYTPLMAAAGHLPLPFSKPADCLKTCKALIELGADKNIRDHLGETALGKFRKGDFASLSPFSWPRPPGPDSAMELLLKPLLGATQADDAILAAVEDSASDGDPETEDDSETMVEESDEDA